MEQRGCSDLWRMPSIGPSSERKGKRPRVVKWLVQGHTASYWWDQILRLRPSDSQISSLMSALGCLSGVQLFWITVHPCKQTIGFIPGNCRSNVPFLWEQLVCVPWCLLLQHTLGLWWLASGFYWQWGSSLWWSEQIREFTENHSLGTCLLATSSISVTWYLP